MITFNGISESLLGGGIAIGILIFILVLAFIIVVPFVVFELLGRYKLFKKMGKEGWEAIIPFYSSYTLCEISGLDTYWFILMVAPTLISIGAQFVEALSIFSFIGNIAVILANVAVAYNLRIKFNKDNTWVVLAALFSGIIIPYMGFNSDQPDMNAEVSKDAFFQKK